MSCTHAYHLPKYVLLYCKLFDVASAGSAGNLSFASSSISGLVGYVKAWELPLVNL